VPLDHLKRRHTHTLRCVPQIVFDASPGVLSEGNANRGKWVGQTEGRLVGEE
jgi:hypothetical protein